MDIQREFRENIIDKFFRGKALILIGARQIGKTTLIKEILNEYRDILVLNGDDTFHRQLLDKPTIENVRNVIGGYKIIFIDEAQRIDNIGLTAKIIVDEFKDVQLILSGSSAFEIKNQTSESLTGRKWEYILFPITWRELEISYGYVKSMEQLENRVVYGMYPEIITHIGEEGELLKLLIDSYLYKDMLAFNDIKKPEILERLLTALALQIGNEVSYTELSNLLGIDKKTVQNYIDILIKNFVIFTITGYNKNVRNELKRAKKIYFWDTGVRNAIIGQFGLLSMRGDSGALWENFLIAERLKQSRYHHVYRKSYFWRTTTQLEIDLVEVEGDTMNAFEFKWGHKSKIKKISSFTDAYMTEIKLVNQSNFRDFLMEN